MTAVHRTANRESAATDIPEYLDDAVETSVPRVGVLGFARMTGSSICGRDAAAWVTDFLNAAYYRRPAAERDVDDLRLAFSILTTYWYGKPNHKRLHASDLVAYHRAFGAHRFDVSHSARGKLSRDQLEAGARALLGDWFIDAYTDDARRGWGIAFATPEQKAAYDPEVRLELARLGELTPERAPLSEQVWHTYPPVQMPSAEGVIAALTAPETWPDYASEIGRFTPLRNGGLDGQVFEIEVAAGTGTAWPMFTRGYVTISRLVTPDDPAALRAYFDAVEEGMREYGHDEPSILPYAAKPVVGFDLTTHAGHFMGAGHNRLLLYTHDAKVWVRAAGTWDPMPWHIDQAYQIAGREAQHAFWGEGNVATQSLLHQLALQVAKGPSPMAPKRS
jgi:hypothetical protein